MLQRVGADELQEWMAYRKLDPWGEQRADLRSAIVARELHRTGFRGVSKPKAIDFMPDFDPPAPDLRKRANQFQAWALAAQSQDK